MPRFHIRDSFATDDKTTFVMAGFVVEGEVTAGMIVGIPFNSSIRMTSEIERVEVIHRPDGDVTCLCIRCRTADELTLWEALQIKDQTVEVAPA